MIVSLTSEMTNQLVGQTCPASSTFINGKKYIRLRYCPREPVMINIDTSNRINLDVNKERKNDCRENKEPFGL